MIPLLRRVQHLEAALPPSRRDRCPICALVHARKISIDEARLLVRVVGGTPMPVSLPGAVRPGPFCLCGCCADARGLARLTQGLGGGA